MSAQQLNNMNRRRIPKSWILLVVFIVSVIGAGAYVFTTPPNGLTNQTGSFFGNTSNDANNYTSDRVNVMNYFGTVVGTYLDSYSCDGDYCIYKPWYDISGNVYVKNMTTGKIDNISANLDVVYSSVVGSNRKIVIMSNNNPYTWSSEIVIPNQTYYMETIGVGKVYIYATGATGAFNNIIRLNQSYTGSGVSGYKQNNKLTFKGIRFDCQGVANTALNLSQPENSYSTIVERIETTNCNSYSIIMDGNEDSVVRDSTLHGFGNKSLLWRSAYGNGIVEDTFLGGEANVSGQQIVFQNSELYNITYSANAYRSSTLELDHVYFNLASGIVASPQIVIPNSVTLNRLVLDDVYAHQQTSLSFINTTGSGTVSSIEIGNIFLTSTDGTKVEFINGRVTNWFGMSPVLTNGAVFGNSSTNAVHGLVYNGNRMDVVSTGINDILWFRRNLNESDMFFGLGNRSDLTAYTRFKDVQFDTTMSLPTWTVRPTQNLRDGIVGLNTSISLLECYSGAAWHYCGNGTLRGAS